MKTKFIIYFSIATFILIGSINVYAQNDFQSQKQRLQSEINEINKELNATESKSKDVMQTLSLTQKKIKIWNQLLKESNLEIININNKIKEKENNITELNTQFDTLQNNFSKVIKSIYENRETKIWYLYIIGSENIGQMFRRISYLTQLSQELTKQANQLKEQKQQIEKEKDQLKKLNNQAVKLKEERIQQTNQLKQDEAASKVLLSDLQKEKAKYRKEINNKKKELDKINKEIEKLRKSVSNKSKSKTKPKDNTIIDTALDKEFAKNKGKLPWPIIGEITEHYGKRFHPIFKNVQLPFNNGITIAVSPNADVKAVFNGVVKQIVIIPGYNKCVLIQHGNYYSFYCKLKDVSVKAGDKIKTGQIIGTVDTIDKTSQLHFQIWKGSQPNDPEQWLKK